MGACGFGDTAAGRDAQDAFNTAVRDAQYENGHGGYSGTIAEKSSFTLITLPKGVTPKKFWGWINAVEQNGYGGDDLQYAQENADRLKGRRGADFAERRVAAAKRLTAIKTAARKAARAVAAIPAEHRIMVREAFNISDDKWGPALCVEITGKDAREFKTRHGMKGTRNRVFYFTGMASS